MKRSKLAQRALKHPELFSGGELAYFERWLAERRERKEKEKSEKQKKEKSDYLRQFTTLFYTLYWLCLLPETMTVTINERGHQNVFAREPQMYIDPIIQEKMEKGIFETHSERAEKLNGRLAMVGIIAAFGSYIMTGQIIPGIW